MEAGSQQVCNDFCLLLASSVFPLTTFIESCAAGRLLPTLRAGRALAGEEEDSQVEEGEEGQEEEEPGAGARCS